jgi:Flp pilus assembly protein TadD
VGGRLEQAARAFAKAVALDPSNGPALFNLGVVRNKSGDTAGAVDCFQQAAVVGHERAKKLLTARNIGW